MHKKLLPLALIFLSLSIQSVIAAPRVEVEEGTYDFGETLQGSQIDHVFRIRNTGDQPLVIERVRSSCGCTAALLSASEIPAGGSGEVQAKFNAGVFRGHVDKAITLYTNVPDRPTTVLRIRGRVLPLLEAEPAEINFGALQAGTYKEMSLVLLNRSDRPVHLSASASNPAHRVKLQPGRVPPGGKVKLLIGIEPRTGESPNGYLLIDTDHPTVPQLRLVVYGSPPA